MEKRRLYMDYSATTPVKKEVLEAMMPYYTTYFGNASSFHQFGREAKEGLDKARAQVAALINAEPREVFFTNGGTESDNWALEGTAFARKDKGNHIITTKIEHHAILHTCEYLQKVHGFEVTYLDVDAEGKVDLDQLKRVISDNTILVSVMYANNEVGTIQPIKEITKIAHQYGALMHTDAVQASGNIPVDVKDLDVDLMSMSGHKIYGPKGIGALFVKKGVKIHNFIHGRAQEKKKRAGTENIPAIVGYGKAAELAKANMEHHVTELTRLREKLLNGIVETIPHVKVNGHRTDRLPGNANISFEFIEGEGILLLLDQLGIGASSGSACTSGSLDPSHVLMALGLPHELAHGSLRLTVGDFTTEDDIDYILENLPKVIARLRELSPLYQTYLKEHPEEK